eukprot:6195865-Pleurochrysis_carterae.AAC.3
MGVLHNDERHGARPRFCVERRGGAARGRSGSRPARSGVAGGLVSASQEADPVMHVGEDSREADAHVNEDGGSESKSNGEDASLLPENGLDGMSLTAERKAAMVDCLFSAQKLLESSSLAEDAASIALAHLREPRRLYRFLCVSDFDPTAAAQMLVDYAGYCANGLRPASAEAAAVILSAGLVEVIPERDLEGRAVLLVRDVRVLGELLQTHTLEEVAAAHLWLLEERVLVDDRWTAHASRMPDCCSQCTTPLPGCNTGMRGEHRTRPERIVISVRGRSCARSA